MTDENMQVNLTALKFMTRQTNAIIKLRQALNDALPGGWGDCEFAEEIDALLDEGGAFEEEE